jgi:diamine N-acetyltransferase
VGTAPISIRRGVSDDAEALAALGEATFRDAYAADTADGAIDLFVARQFGHTAQRDELADPACRFLLAEADGYLVGYLLLRRAPAPAVVPGRRRLLVDRLYVLASWQDRGIGGSLLDRADQEARGSGHDVLWLSVWERNPRALAFYERRGFAAVGETHFDLAGVRQRDRLMVRRLA